MFWLVLIDALPCRSMIYYLSPRELIPFASRLECKLYLHLSMVRRCWGIHKTCEKIYVDGSSSEKKSTITGMSKRSLRKWREQAAEELSGQMDQVACNRWCLSCCGWLPSSKGSSLWEHIIVDFCSINLRTRTCLFDTFKCLLRPVGCKTWWTEC